MAFRHGRHPHHHRYGHRWRYPFEKSVELDADPYEPGQNHLLGSRVGPDKQSVLETNINVLNFHRHVTFWDPFAALLVLFTVMAIVGAFTVVADWRESGVALAR